MNATNGAELWNYTTGNGVWSSPLVVNGVVFVGSDDGSVYALGASPTSSNILFIIIGVVVVVVIVAAVVILMFKKRFKTKPTKPQPPPKNSV